MHWSNFLWELLTVAGKYCLISGDSLSSPLMLLMHDTTLRKDLDEVYGEVTLLSKPIFIQTETIRYEI